MEPLRIADDDLKARLRAYLKSSVDLVLRRDDFNGEEKADLASSIAQVGQTRRHRGPGDALSAPTSRGCAAAGLRARPATVDLSAMAA